MVRREDGKFEIDILTKKDKDRIPFPLSKTAARKGKQKVDIEKFSTQKVVKVKAYKRVTNGKIVKVLSHYLFNTL